MNTFGEKIKKYRLDNNLTQNDLANKLHVSRQTISKWETGSSYPNYDILKEISLMLNTTVDELLSKEEIVKETVTGKSKINRNRLFVIILSALSSIALIIGIVSIIIASNKKDDEKIIVEEKDFIGFVLIKEKALFDDEVERPTLEDLSKQDYAGIYKPYDWCGISAIRASNVSIYTVNGDEKEEKFEATFNIKGVIGDMINILNIYQDKNTKELTYEDGRLSGISGVKFEIINNKTKYYFDLNFTYIKEVASTIIKEYNNEFKLIKETEIDFNNLSKKEIGTNKDGYYKFSPTDECLYVIIEDNFIDKIEKRFIWKEEMNKSKILYHSPDDIFASFIRFEID